jgi:pimeloyl-ACP methyl ester carboxylesterase
VVRVPTQAQSPQDDPIPDALLEDIHWGAHHEWNWNGQRCHWRHLGNPDHPPLVLIHGFAAGCGHWRRNAAALAAAGWSVYGIDLVGFGASSQPGSLKLDNRLWARQVQGFLQGVVQQPAVLVGHSLGGLVALTCSVFFPKLVLAVIAAPLPDPTLLMVRPEEANLNWPRARWKRIAKRWLVEILCRILPLEIVVPLLAHSPLLDLAIQTAYLGPVIGDRGLHHVIANPARRPGAVRALRAMSIGMALRPTKATAPSLLRRLRRPMLLIWGDQDVLVPLQVGWQCQRFRNDLAVSVIPQAGHCPHDEKPDLFNGVVIAWLMNLSIPPLESLSQPKRASEHVP